MLLVLLLWASVCARAQFSPGALSKAHKSLSGPTQCTACHTLATGGRKFRCLSCHSEIRARLTAHRGLHPSLVKEVRDQNDCTRCHAEHNGEGFVPIRWDVDLDEFDHGKTGYVLEGGHRGLQCKRCHAPKNIPVPERRNIITKDLTRTYLGLSRECLGCHGKPHRQQISTDCLKCHTFSKWKPASRFDHAQAKFQVAGAHQKVTCEKCHPKVGDAPQYTKFTGLAFSTCDACHKDPHRQAFSAPCQSCHSNEGWKTVQVTSQFDHRKTKFALLGRHSGLACGKCHSTSNFKEPVAHARCADCHRTDLHRGQFASRADHGECSACHVVDGWKPATFTVAAHQSTRYPLDGRHRTVACAKCHTPAGQATLYRVKSGQCGDCHRDEHDAQFAGPPHMNRCEDCHTVKGFTPATFSLAKHVGTRLPLAGAHAAVPCAECHYPQPGGLPRAGRFRFADVACAGCHEDPHQGQFKSRMLAVLAGGAVAGCEACHNSRTWRDVLKFDHSTSDFRLSGTHRGVACDKCHRPAAPGASIKAVVFRSAPKQCSGCHEDAHGGQFQALSGTTDCARCHGPLAWKPASFDHDTATTFTLTGAHRGVQCRQCHPKERQISGKTVVLFKPTSKECSGCHGPKTTS